MEFVVKRDTLLPVLGTVAGVVERRQTLPILGNLLLVARGDRTTITGTDLEVQVENQCAAEIREEGETTVPARKLLDICRNLEEGVEVRFRVKDERCVITSGRGRFSLGILPAADFPSMESEIGGLELALEEGRLKRLLDKTSFAMAQQDVRYYLNGLLIELDSSGLTAVATDGHRLAMAQSGVGISIDDRRQIIVPSKTVLELRRQLHGADEEIALRVGEKSIEAVVGQMRMTSKLVDGRYPNYEQVIPRELSKRAVLKKEDLRRALSRTSILSNEKYRGVRLAFGEDVLKLQAHNPEQEEAEEEIEIQYQDEMTAIGFNVAYLMDVLGAVDGGEVQVQFQDGDSSSVWRGVGVEGETFVVMPMRL